MVCQHSGAACGTTCASQAAAAQLPNPCFTKLWVLKQQQPQTCLLARRRISACSARLIYLDNYVVICFCVSCYAERIYQDLIADALLLVLIATGIPTCGAADQDQCKDA